MPPRPSADPGPPPPPFEWYDKREAANVLPSGVVMPPRPTVSIPPPAPGPPPPWEWYDKRERAFETANGAFEAVKYWSTVAPASAVRYDKIKKQLDESKKITHDNGVMTRPMIGPASEGAMPLPALDAAAHTPALEDLWSAVRAAAGAGVGTVVCDVAPICDTPHVLPQPGLKVNEGAHNIPPAFADFLVNMELTRTLAFSSLTPGFVMLFDHGLIPKTDPINDEPPIPDRNCVVDTDDEWRKVLSSAFAEPPFLEAAALERMHQPMDIVAWHFKTFYLREGTGYTVYEAFNSLRKLLTGDALLDRAVGGCMFGFLRSVLLQVTLALEAAQAEFKFVHGGMNVTTVRVKYLQRYEGRDWLFRSPAWWKVIKSADHRGILVKISDFRGSMGVVTTDGRMTVSTATRLYDKYGDGGQDALFMYDIGCFCWSLVCMLDRDVLACMQAAVGPALVTDLLHFCDCSAHTTHLRAMMSCASTAVEVANALPYLLPNNQELWPLVASRFGKVVALLRLLPDSMARSIIQARAPMEQLTTSEERDAQLALLTVVEWITSVLHRHIEAVAAEAKKKATREDMAGPAAPPRRRPRNTCATAKRSEADIFRTCDVSDETGVNNAVAMSTLVARVTAYDQLNRGVPAGSQKKLQRIAGSENPVRARLYNEQLRRTLATSCYQCGKGTVAAAASPLKIVLSGAVIQVRCCSEVCAHILTGRVRVVSPLDILQTDPVRRSDAGAPLPAVPYALALPAEAPAAVPGALPRLVQPPPALPLPADLALPAQPGGRPPGSVIPLPRPAPVPARARQQPQPRPLIFPPALAPAPAPARSEEPEDAAFWASMQEGPVVDPYDQDSLFP